MSSITLKSAIQAATTKLALYSVFALAGFALLLVALAILFARY
jgi:hypothetical protein